MDEIQDILNDLPEINANQRGETSDLEPFEPKQTKQMYQIWEEGSITSDQDIKADIDNELTLPLQDIVSIIAMNSFEEKTEEEIITSPLEMKSLLMDLESPQTQLGQEKSTPKCIVP